MQNCQRVVLLIFIITAFSGIALAQRATLTGTVVDQQGAVVPNVAITVLNVGQGLKREATTDERGYFAIRLLQPGRYVVMAQREGFFAAEIPNVVLHVGDAKDLTIELQVGAVAQTITVEGGAPLLNKESGAVSTVVDRQFVENLPLNGRSFQQLITLTPGVVLTKAFFGNEGQFSVNGQRANANYFTVDGVSANFGVPANSATGISAGGTVPALTIAGGTNSLVSVDAMQEFRIQTSTYAPEFGRQPGGQISIVTRSGSNDFHGTVFEYFRNDKLDATDWFANADPNLEKPPLRQNDFGGVLGGPIVPDKTFFFFSYEGQRLRQPQVAIISVPSVASRQAAIPEMQPLLNAYPLPNGPDLGGGFEQFSASFSNQATVDATSIRIDHAFNDKWTLFGRYNHSPSDGVARQINLSNLSSETVTALETQTLTLGSTQIFTPSVSNEIRGNLSRNRGSNFQTPDDFGGAIPPSDSDIFPSFASSSDAFFFMQIIGGSPFVSGRIGANQQRQINLVDNLSVTKGAHQLKFGTDYRWLSPVKDSREYDQVVFFIGLTGPIGALSGNPLLAIVGTKPPVAAIFTNFSAYAQDTWRVTPRLTLTYGLRWEVNPPPHGKNGKELFRVVGLDDPATATLAPKGTPLYETTYDNFAPRVGVAYQLSEEPGKETVLRGGFGLFYDLGASRAVGDIAGAFPHSATKTLFGVSYPLDSANAAPPPLPDPSNPVGVASYGFAPDLKLPRTYQWNLALEQSLGSNQTISVTYLGAIGRRLLRQEVLRNLNPSFSSVTVARNAATSDYHAGQLQFKRRLSRGLQALASYTWSHSIDIASQDSFNSTAVGFLDPKVDRGSSNFDVRHSFSAAVTYNIPSPAKGGVGRALLHDWSIDTLLTARSATPLDIKGGAVVGGTSLFHPRADLVPGEPLYLDDPTVAGGRRLNPAAFDGATPAFEIRQGTLGRNVLRGFRMSQVDFALRRQFRLSEKLNLQFRAEFFNLFNHPNFADPNSRTDRAFFGEATQMLGRSLGTGTANNGGFNPLYQVGGPRSIQFALKLVF